MQTEILYHQDDLIIVNKPAWLISHPSDEARHLNDSVMQQVRNLVGQRVYLINRLDRQVSGLMLLSPSQDVVRFYQEHWHECTKKYLGLAHGTFEQPFGQLNFALKKKDSFQEARTDYKVITQFKDCALLELTLYTGRYHQIRRHLARRMHALIGDRKYGKKVWNDPFKETFGLERIFLHCHEWNFKELKINSPLPEELNNIIKHLS